MRTTATKRRTHEDKYLALVQQFPLRPLRSSHELDNAVAMIDSLLDRPLDGDERDYLAVLSDLVERYESVHEEIKPQSDCVMLRHLIEAKGVRQADVAKGCRIAESTISAVLSGARKLNRWQVAKLAKYFHVPATVFSLEE
ncbi:MAG: transcriptional regulator [Gemmataceae bacterium]|nr:transcriptional regulator [Gemmataceae bacterium]